MTGRRTRRVLLAVLLMALSTIAHAATRVNTESLRLSFDSRGNLESAFACFPACEGERVRLQQFGESSVVRFEPAGPGPWTVSEARSEAGYQISFRQDGGASVTWRIPRRGYRLELELHGLESAALRSGESFRPRAAAGFGVWLEQSRYVILDDDGARQVGFDDAEAPQDVQAAWLGYRNRFWTLVTDPPGAASANLHGAAGKPDADIRFSGVDGTWSLYLGPVEPDVLKQAGAGLDRMLYAGLWFWLRWICIGLFHLLGWIQAFLPAWGLAIMALSLSVNVLMTPLSRVAQRFQDEVNDTEARLAPELQRIKKQFNGEEQAAKILALYKTERVHPLYSLKSLMGVAVVIPVFIGAFDMLAENIHLLNTPFLWIADLSRPDDLFNLPFTLPFFGNELNALPFLMTGLSVIASALHNPLAPNAELRKKQVRNMLLLAVAFFVLFYTFPAGMVLYWTTNNLISVIKSLWARR